MSLPFWKVQSVGNDFVLVHGADIVGADLAQLSQEVCRRHFGVGSDGLLVIEPGPPVSLRMFNPDGTEDFCGNGIRCAAIHAREMGWVDGPFELLHGGQMVPIEFSGEEVVSVIGPASYRPDDVPVDSLVEMFGVTVFSEMVGGMPMNLFGSALTTGSTHVVLPLYKLPDEDTFRLVSPMIEHDGRFPKHASVIWVEEVESMRIKIRIWERGAGETMGCGTGSAAAAADYLRRKNRDGEVAVVNPGGTVYAKFDAWDSRIQVRATAQTVYTGTYSMTADTLKTPAQVHAGG